MFVSKGMPGNTSQSTKTEKSRVLLINRANPGEASPVQPQPENFKKHKTNPAPHPGFGCSCTSQVQVHGCSQQGAGKHLITSSLHSDKRSRCSHTQAHFQFCFLLLVQLRRKRWGEEQQSPQVSRRWGQPLSACGIHLWAMQWMRNRAQPCLAQHLTPPRALNQHKCLCSELRCAPEFGARSPLKPRHCWARGTRAGRSAGHLSISSFSHLVKPGALSGTKTSTEDVSGVVSLCPKCRGRWMRVKSEQVGKLHSHCDRTEIRGEMQLLLPGWNAAGTKGICSCMINKAAEWRHHRQLLLESLQEWELHGPGADRAAKKGEAVLLLKSLSSDELGSLWFNCNINSHLHPKVMSRNNWKWHSKVWRSFPTLMIPWFSSLVWILI